MTASGERHERLRRAQGRRGTLAGQSVGPARTVMEIPQSAPVLGISASCRAAHRAGDGDMSDPVGIETSGPPLSTPSVLAAARHRFAPTIDAASRRIEIRSIRPTQITVGRLEVEEKRRRYRQAVASGDERPPRDPVPVVLGANATMFALDRHHWLCALLAENVFEVSVQVQDDLSNLDEASFWRTLDRRGWCHPYGADGRPLSYAAIPTFIGELQDDPFRSLAGALRRKGGFEKSKALFSEFRWAVYLREHIDPSLVIRDFDGALATAILLADRDAPASKMATNSARSGLLA